MQLQPSQPSAEQEVRVDALVRTHWALAVCVVCGHEQIRGERSRASCPGCGAQLRMFPLFRDLRAEL